MPDGHMQIFGTQVIYKNVTRKHSGTYVCEGSNGSGYIAQDTIKIDVIRKTNGNLTLAVFFSRINISRSAGNHRGKSLHPGWNPWD